MTLDRRAMMTGMAGLALPHSVQAQAQARAIADRRPPPGARKFTSPAVEACIGRVRRAFRDPDLAALFANCFPNTLDTTVTLGESGGKPDTFVITGDIDAMWLRDSSAQMWPYLEFTTADESLRTLFRGLIARQARCIRLDPYANAFLRDATAPRLDWAVGDDTDMKPGIGERKWEIDSLCYPIRLAHGYWRATLDTTPFDEDWRDAMRLAVATLREQQRKTGPGPYHFQRKAPAPTETQALAGYGWPARPVGLIHSGFRPSDDACSLPFLVPSNHFAVVALRHLAEMAPHTGLGDAFAAECLAFGREVAAALAAYGKMRLPSGETVWAYEVDGFGGAIFMDDANVPSLLALPYLGACDRRDALYRATRKAVWSAANPYFFSGKAGEGIGGPHVGLDMIWPMSLTMRALTSDDCTEIAISLNTLKTAAAASGFMHESFHKDDAAHFTRPWFAWANTLFGEMLLDVWRRYPDLVA